ncbi:MAG: hypothetical protein LLF96_02635 [Eubacteriales bacterium]|nr:hypothetical protein [Eubacteriales bacterium]
MLKNIVKSSLIGASVGIALGYLAAIVVSYQLRLGYFMATLAALPERVGGEMNAVLFQTAICALLGAGVNVACKMAGQKTWTPRKRALWASVSLAVGVMASAGVVIGMMK